MHILVWTDLQHVLAVAEQGSLAAAARALGVNHTTVLRRVGAFERSLGVKVFARSPTGYVLTSAGEEIAAAARAMQDTVHAIERKVAGRDLRLTGTVRVTTTDTLAVELVPTALAAFTAAHPGIQLELTTTPGLANLTKRDADVAVRATSTPPPHLVGRRAGTIAFALYASPAYLERIPARRALDGHTWIGLDDSLATTTIARWMARTLDVIPVLRTDSFTALAHAARAGLGVTALPCYLGDRTPGLQRVRGLIPEMATELWVLTHEDLRGTARIRALTDHLVTSLGAKKAALEGRGA
ncbi:MAG TPA: LysR family transcriptional regulator [Kofleriaceae bacterium]|jgi:DNA-binding transcriptional LysR family regulator|nr:LysR family transcriptional regulator [Kofleriaceae bacterium]